MDNEQIEQVALCVQQKLALMTNILNLTKQIEVQCSQPDIELGDLLQKRQAYMDRIDKCNALITQLTNELPLDEKEHIKQLLNGKEKEAGCSKEELPILQSAQKYNEYLQLTVGLDKNASQHMQKQCDELKKTINQQRKNQKNTSLYDIH